MQKKFCHLCYKENPTPKVIKDGWIYVVGEFFCPECIARAEDSMGSRWLTKVRRGMFATVPDPVPPPPLPGLAENAGKIDRLVHALEKHTQTMEHHIKVMENVADKGAALITLNIDLITTLRQVFALLKGYFGEKEDDKPKTAS